MTFKTIVLNKIIFIVTLFIIGTSLMAGEKFHTPGELIVKFKNGADRGFWARRIEGVKLKRVVRLSYGELYVVEVTKNRTIREGINILESYPEIKYVEPNYIYSIVGGSEENLPNDPYFNSLWGLHNTGTHKIGKITLNGKAGADIGALRAWQITKGSSQVKIAVIDTGIDYSHPDLKDNMWVNEQELNGIPGKDDDQNGLVDDIHGYNFVEDSGDPMDDHGHGTHCAGSIGALQNDEKGVAGVMGDVRLVALKFLNKYGSGDLEDAVRAIDYAVKADVDIMSNSWGGGSYSNILKEAIEVASEKGILFVAAAGNSSGDNDKNPHFPSNYQVPNVISVASMNIKDKLSSFSCYGKNTVHVAAPGEKILSTWKGGNYNVISGTSMATPHVSGALGLLLAEEGRMPHDEVKERLMKTSVPVRAYRRKVAASGRVNAYNLLVNHWPEPSWPDEKLWKPFPLEEEFESSHPYGNKEEYSKTFKVPGVRYIRIKISEYELEKKYDFIIIKDKNGIELERISGKGENYSTDYIEGDEITVTFKSDYSKTMWGFVIKEVETIE